MDGFSLIDLLLSVSIGALLSSSLFQTLMIDLQNGQRLTRQAREGQLQQRTLALIQDDINHANGISANPQLEWHGCNLAGRLPVLHLSTDAGAITYSIGAAPSPIWRGQVLMRCGPAFALDGSWNGGLAPQNRVVIDGLASRPPTWTGCQALVGAQGIDLAGSAQRGFSACLSSRSGLVGLRLVQNMTIPEGSQTISRETLTQN